jgi:hypothetical protein
MADALKEAQLLYADALGELGDQRRQIEDDLAFSDPSDPDQWDSAIKSQRTNDPGGARPCLVFDQTGQYVSNVAGQIERAPPALHALPVGGGADKRAAEQLDGFFRHIEHVSRAKQHYSRALTSAARVGVGYLVVRPTYVDRALNWQEPRISSEPDPMRVVLDPWSQELDGSDAKFGYLLTPFSKREFERMWPKEKPISFGDVARSDGDDRDSILVAEQWRTETKTRNMIVCGDAEGGEVSVTEDDFWRDHQGGATLRVLFDDTGKPRTYTDRYDCVKWARMSGDAYLEEETEYPASGIGIVPVYGYVAYARGRMTYCGIPRRAMTAQRSYNYHMSEMHAYMGQAPKSPWVVPVRAVLGLKEIWDRASVEARSYLPYHDIDETGQPIAAPQRTPHTTNLQNHIAGADQALRDIQASIGMYQANLGAPSNETSGVAIDARKEQGEASTAHFPANLSASLGQVGKLCMDMIPRLIDKPRQVRILGIDETPGSVTINPQQQGAVVESQGELSINPNVGRYDVRVVVGASYATQRSQAQAAFTEMMRANPALTPALAPLWAQTLDVPHADKLAQVLTAMAPEPVKAVLQPEQQGKPTTEQLVGQVEQLKQALQEAIQHAQDAQADADQAQAECERLKNDSETRERELEIKAYDAETKRAQVLGLAEKDVKLLVVQTIEQMLSRPDPLPGEAEPESAAMQAFPAGDMGEQSGMMDAPMAPEMAGGPEGEME